MSGEEHKEALNIFPALWKYQEEHSELNLQKLCVEVAQFCESIYASTTNPNERVIYKKMLENLKTKADNY